MFRKSIVLLSVCLMALALAPSVTTAKDGNTGYVYCDPAHDSYCRVSAGDTLVITNRWGACHRGLVKAFLMAIEVQEYTLTARDGTVVWSLGTEAAQDLWGPTEEFWGESLQFCVTQVSTGYISYWEYELDDLEPGKYTLGFTLSLGSPVIDGIDFDGDGRPDQYMGQLKNTTVDIRLLGH